MSEVGSEVMYNLELRDGFSRIGRLSIGDRQFETPAVVPFEELKKLKLNTFVPLNLKLLDKDRFEKLRKNDTDLLVFNVQIETILPGEFASLIKEYIVDRVMKIPAYIPTVATAYSIPLLSYFGFEVFDTAMAEVLASKGVMMLENGEVDVNKLRENPCNCRICSTHGKEVFEDEELLKEHNTLLMEAKAKLTRELIRRGELRNYVESAVKHSPFYTATLRIFDSMWCKEYPYPRFRKSKAIFCSQESFYRPEVRYFLERVCEIYTPATKAAVVLPCSARKPYSLSKSHRKIRSVLKAGVLSEIVVSSPLVTPRELELCYPVCNYDVAVTGSWGLDEIEFVANYLARLISNFEEVAGYLSGGYRRVFERACKIAGVDGKIVDLDGLKDFAEKHGERFNLYREMFRLQSVYQFGKDIVGSKARVRGKYPEIELFKEKRVARFDVSRGMLDVYDAEFVMETYPVKIDEFKPKGTIFAAGVLKADRKIKPGDLVAFYNSEWMGVGIARTSGVEMESLDEGYAIDVKRVMARNKN